MSTECRAMMEELSIVDELNRKVVDALILIAEREYSRHISPFQMREQVGAIADAVLGLVDDSVRDAIQAAHLQAITDQKIKLRPYPCIMRKGTSMLVIDLDERNRKNMIVSGLMNGKKQDRVVSHDSIKEARGALFSLIENLTSKKWKRIA